ncbi:MAG: DUF1905 domain-containing protein [Ferruginibacter sp.]|nr:DUF1905 domain-containing protein [Ferruginibacter sp.]
MIKFTATILKFDKKGEKTGWTYIIIPSEMAQQLYPGNKKSFRVKGKLDAYAIEGVALIPMGEGDFIMSLNAVMRKNTGKTKGALLIVEITVDKKQYQLNAALMDCLADEPEALAYLKSLPTSHQNYFSKWIESARTEPTKTKRITMVVNALAKKWTFPQMLHADK